MVLHNAALDATEGARRWIEVSVSNRQGVINGAEEVMHAADSVELVGVEVEQYGELSGYGDFRYCRVSNGRETVVGLSLFPFYLRCRGHVVTLSVSWFRASERSQRFGARFDLDARNASERCLLAVRAVPMVV